MSVADDLKLNNIKQQYSRVRSLRESGAVSRFHTQTMHKENNVAAHSWGVAMLIICLHDNPSKELIAAALFHDAGELISGDTPYTSKLLDSNLDASLKAIEKKFLIENGIDYEAYLTELEKAWLKACDMLDLIFTCTEEMDLGNNRIRSVYNNGVSALRSRVETPKEVLSILDLIEESFG